MRMTLLALVPTRPALPALTISVDDPDAPPICSASGVMICGISMKMLSVLTMSIQK